MNHRQSDHRVLLTVDLIQLRKTSQLAILQYLTRPLGGALGGKSGKERREAVENFRLHQVATMERTRHSDAKLYVAA